MAVVPRTVGVARLAEQLEVGDASAFGATYAWLVRPDGHLAARLPLGQATPAALDELVAGSLR